MPLPPVPGEEQVGEHIVAGAGDMADSRQAEQAPEPGVARGAQPERDGAIGADIKTAVGVNSMQAAAYIVDVRTEVLERVGLDIDVAEFYSASASGADETVALPIDAGVTHRAFGVVPNDEGWQRFHSLHRLGGGGTILLPQFIAVARVREAQSAGADV